MSNNKQLYSVFTNAITDSDKVILKLIFSVSQRTHSRNIVYQLCDDVAQANVVIHAANNLELTADKSKLHIWLDSPPNNTGVKTALLRPLIATRVLSFLDTMVDTHLFTNIAPDNEIELQHTDLESDIQDMDFSISEEEASVLAIVHDESISNPANCNTSAKEMIGNIENMPNYPEPTIVPKIALNKPALNVVTLLPKTSSSQKGGSTNSADSTQQQLRSLVVDDSASVRKQLELELDLFQTKVDFAEDAQSAFDLLDKHYYDVAFLDVVLPDKDGFQICKHIKATSKTTKVIMLTGKATPADKVRGSLAGCNAYLVKPVGRMTFQATVKNYLTPALVHDALEANAQQ